MTKEDYEAWLKVEKQVSKTSIKCWAISNLTFNIFTKVAELKRKKELEEMKKFREMSRPSFEGNSDHEQQQSPDDPDPDFEDHDYDSYDSEDYTYSDYAGVEEWNNWILNYYFSRSYKNILLATLADKFEHVIDKTGHPLGQDLG